MGLHDELVAWLASKDSERIAVEADRDRLTAQVAALSGQHDADQSLIEQLQARIADLEAGQPPAPASTLFGWCVATLAGESYAAALARRDRTYGPGRALRKFFQPGRVPTWEQTGDDRLQVVSFKAHLTDEQAAAFFAAGKPGHVWTYYHEPEDNIERGEFTAAALRAEWVRLRAIQQRVNPALRSCMILMGYTLTGAKGRDWRNYYPGDDVVDVLGWDVYSTPGRVRYTAPEQVFGRCVQVSRDAGKPFGFAEWASVLAPGDDGSERADWMRAAGAYHRDAGALFSTYFDSPNGGEYRLLDAPSQQAMRGLLAL